MSLKTIYCVQPFWRDGAELAQGSLSQHLTKREAFRAADKAYQHHAGVIVYAVSGDPAFETWSSPRLVRSVGTVLQMP